MGTPACLGELEQQKEWELDPELVDAQLALLGKVLPRCANCGTIKPADLRDIAQWCTSCGERLSISIGKKKGDKIKGEKIDL
jgi:hypothetical protein